MIAVDYLASTIGVASGYEWEHAGVLVSCLYPS
jgi:hypothetical protein